MSGELTREIDRAASERRSWADPRWRDALLLGGAGAAAWGLAAATVPWPALLGESLDMVILAFLALTIGWSVRRLWNLPWLVALALPGLLALAIRYAGVDGALATLLLVAGGLACGTLLPNKAGLSPWVGPVAGLGLLAGITGWLLPFPVHHPALWVLALGLLVWFRRVPILAQLRAMQVDLRTEAAAAPVAAGAWGLVLLLASTPAWLPVGHADDLAYHLALGNELRMYGHARFDVGSQAWALAPWGSDVLHALVFLVSGDDRIGPLNVIWLGLTGILVQVFGRRLGLSAPAAWLASMLYLSLPLSAFLASSMQTEPATAAALVALALILVDGSPEQRSQRIPAMAVLAGFALGLKISNVLLLLPFLAWWLWQWRGMPPLSRLPLAVSLGLLAGASSYAYALLLTGSPVVPMFNEWFRTPWFPAVNFVDQTWQTGLWLTTPWELLFHTDRYFEGQPGAAGVALAVLAGGFVGSVARPALRIPFLVGVIAFVLPFSQVQYLRYAHPALTVLLPVLVAGLVKATAGWRLWLLGAVVAVQLLLMPTSSWKFSSGALGTLLREGQMAVSDQYVPERAVTRRFRERASATDRLLFLDPRRSHGAEIPGLGVGTAWFTPLVPSVHTEMPPTELDRVIARAGANHVMVHDIGAWPQIIAWLEARDAREVDRNGAASLFWLPPLTRMVRVEESSGPAYELPVEAPYPVLVQAGVLLACDAPGKPVAVSWQLPAARYPAGNWQWLNCGPEGLLLSLVQGRVMPGEGPLRFAASPALPDAPMNLRPLADVADIRRDFQAETALRDVALSRVCGRCTPARQSNVQPLAHGTLAEHLSRLEQVGGFE